MRVHVLVEGPSERALVERWAPRAFKGHEFVVRPHQGKGTLPQNLDARPDPRHRGLLDLLPATLRAYASTPSMADDGVLVLVDADTADYAALESRLIEFAARQRPLRVVVRFAVEELEAFYLGDLRALKAAFPRADMAKARAYQPDSIVGTAELFDEIIDDGGLRKVVWAERMGAHLTTRPAKSRSPSFRALCKGISDLVATVKRSGPPRKKHWKARHSSQRKQRGG